MVLHLILQYLKQKTIPMYCFLFIQIIYQRVLFFVAAVGSESVEVVDCSIEVAVEQVVGLVSNILLVVPDEADIQGIDNNSVLGLLMLDQPFLLVLAQKLLP